ncbi:MAG: hypothetical protein IKD13_02130, partial [Firmicutes bacterium]|nr:hypothetical protein [Bacillota bacterium]
MPQPIKIGRKTRMSYSKIKEVAPMPNLIDIQTASYDWFMREGLKEVFEDISPIKDYADNLVLEFIDYSISDAPKYDQQECKDRDVTYAAPLKVRVRLVNKETGEVKEQEVFMGDFPIMTEQGTFIYNGAERVIVTQLVRSPGPYYDYTLDKSGNKMFSTTIIPNRGAWLEYETDANEALSVRVDRTRKQPITAILRALSYKSVEEKMESERRKNPGMTDADLAKKIRRVGEYHTQTAGILYEGSNAEIQAVFGHDDRLEKSLSKDTTTNYEEGLKEIYKKLRPGEPATFDSAYELIEALFFDAKRYDLAKVGRYKYNKKLG